MNDDKDFTEFARSLTDIELAASLEFNACSNRSAAAKAVMHEAARRLRGNRAPLPVEPTNPPEIRGYITLPADYFKDKE